MKKVILAAVFLSACGTAPAPTQVKPVTVDTTKQVDTVHSKITNGTRAQGIK